MKTERPILAAPKSMREENELADAEHTPRLPSLSAMDAQSIYQDRFLSLGNMTTLNKPMSAQYVHRDGHNSNDSYQYPNGGFGPTHMIHYPYHQISTNDNYVPPHPYSVVGPRTSSFTTSGPALSFERTPVQPQYNSPPAQANGLPTPLTNQGSVTQPRTPISVKNRRKAEPISTMAPSNRKGAIRLEDLPPRQLVDESPVDKLLYGARVLTAPLSQLDILYVEFLKQEMISLEDAEDNPGMMDTWTKIVKTKPHKVEAACRRMLALFDHTLKGDTLTDRKITTHYQVPMERFRAIGQTLRTQKTVCKHIVEEPYILQVIDDPVGATRRVSNNRRVNDQKAKAINIGRVNLGLKGRGKGAPLERIKSPDGNCPRLSKDVSNDGAATDNGSEYEATPTPSRRRHQRKPAAKRTRKVTGNDDDDDDEYVEHSANIKASPPKRPRRKTTTYARARVAQPALQLDTNTDNFPSESSNEPSSTSTTRDMVAPMSLVGTPQGPRHRHNNSAASFFSADVPIHHSSPDLMPPAMQRSANMDLYYAQYANLQPAMYNSIRDHDVHEDIGASLNDLDVMPTIESEEPFFDLNGASDCKLGYNQY